jgi:hypothetical protein
MDASLVSARTCFFVRALILPLTYAEARLDKLESLIAQQQSQINHLSQQQIAASGPSPQEVATFRSPPVIQTPHIPRPETALFIQKPQSTFPSQNAIQNGFGNTLDARSASVAGNGYGGQADATRRVHVFWRH